MSMMQRGWKARQDAAKAKLAAGLPPELLESLKRTGDRLQAERDAADALAAEQESRRRSTLCSCPSCDGAGELSVEEAAFVASAVRFYRTRNLKTEPDLYAAMNLRVIGPVEAAAPAPAAVAEPKPITPTKPGRPRPVIAPPFLGGGD